MKDVNFSAIAGRLGADAKIHALQECNLFVLSVGTSTSTGTGDNKRTDWTRVNYRVYGDKEYEFLKKYLVSGAAVHVTGSLRSFLNKQEKGPPIKISYVHADSLRILTFRENEAQDPQASGLDAEEAAIASMQDPAELPSQVPQVQRPARGRDAPAVATQPKVQSAAAPGIPLRPAASGEVNF